MSQHHHSLNVDSCVDWSEFGRFQNYVTLCFEAVTSRAVLREADVQVVIKSFYNLRFVDFISNCSCTGIDSMCCTGVVVRCKSIQLTVFALLLTIALLPALVVADHPDDVAALSSLFNATSGPTWANNSGWIEWMNHPQLYSVCNAYGVVCAPTSGRVTSLILTSNQLAGTIPPSLGNLTSLQSLDLSSNQLTGSIPASLGDIIVMKNLDLSENRLVGSIPPSLCNISTLEGLFLNRNQLSGSIPASLGELLALQYLYLYINRLTGTIPSSIGNLRSLLELDFFSNRLTGTIPPSLGNLSSLSKLHLFANLLTGLLPASLGYIPALRSLDLDINQLSGTIPSSFGNLSALQYLDLSANQLTGTIPSSLGNLIALEHMALTTNQLTGTVPESFGNLSSLQNLYLFTNQMTGTIPQSLGQLSTLRSLDLHSNQLTGTIPSSLGNASLLNNLLLYLNKLTGTIPESLCNLFSLESLDISTNQLSGTISASLGQLVSLTTIDFQSNQFTGTIPESLGNLAALQYLDLSTNQLTGSLPSSLSNLSSLYWLHLRSNQLTGTILPSLGELSALEELSLSSNQLSGTMSGSFGNLRALRILDLSANQLTGTIPSSLGDLSALQECYLSMNQFTGTVPMSLGSLARLQKVALSSNQLTGNIPQSFGNLTALKILDLSNNRFFGNLPVSLRQTTSLFSLDLSSNEFSGNFELLTTDFFPAFVNVSNNMLGPTFSPYPASSTVLKFALLDVRSFNARFACPYPNNYPDSVTILRSPCHPSLTEFGIYLGYAACGGVVILVIFLIVTKSNIGKAHISSFVYVCKWISALASLGLDSFSFRIMLSSLILTINHCDPINKFGLFSVFLPYITDGLETTPGMNFAFWFPRYVNHWYLKGGYLPDDPTNIADLTAFRDLCSDIAECGVDSLGTTCELAHPELAQSGKQAFPTFFVCLLVVIVVRGLVELGRFVLIIGSIRSRAIVFGELGAVFIGNSAFAPLLYLNADTRVEFDALIRHRTEVKQTHFHFVVEFTHSALLTALPFLAASTYYSLEVAQTGLSALNMVSILLTLVNSSSLLVRALYMWVVPFCRSSDAEVSAPVNESRVEVPLPATIVGSDVELISVGAMNLPFVRNGSFIAQHVVVGSPDVESSASGASSEPTSQSLQFQSFEMPETLASAI